MRSSEPPICFNTYRLERARQQMLKVALEAEHLPEEKRSQMLQAAHQRLLDVAQSIPGANMPGDYPK